MKSLNRTAANLFPNYTIHAATDITGFGFLGHLLEMLQASQVSARIDQLGIPVFKGVEEFIRSGMIPGGSRQNLDFVNPYVRWESGTNLDTQLLLADAQTSGGLLVSLPEREASGFLDRVREAGCPYAKIVGEIIEKERQDILIIN
jgi:selenide,water dikinase